MEDDVKRFELLSKAQKAAKDTYTSSANCMNCGDVYPVTVLRGTMIIEVAVCPKCGCSMRQIDSYFRKRDGRE